MALAARSAQAKVAQPDRDEFKFGRSVAHAVYVHALSIPVSITAGMLVSMDKSEKVRENRLRRMAVRQGFRLVKTRRLDPLALDYGTYRLVSSKGKPQGPFKLDEVEKRLTTPRRAGRGR